MTTTTTSGAADRAIEDCPELNMGNYDEVDVERLNDWAIRANDEIDRLHALAAGQATAAQQGVAYAALPESFLEIPDVQDESGINTYYSREVVLECIDAGLASHGQAQATAQADTQPALAHNIVSLSPLPNPAHHERVYGGHGNEIVHSYYTEHQMREYARQEVFRAEDAWQARAQADSVLEDAARWRELREQHESDEDLCCVFAPNDMRECLVPVGSLPGELDAFMDSERAARKQGASQ